MNRIGALNGFESRFPLQPGAAAPLPTFLSDGSRTARAQADPWMTLARICTTPGSFTVTLRRSDRL
jgi:hypothetical protein